MRFQVRQRGYASWETLGPVPGEKVLKFRDGKRKCCDWYEMVAYVACHESSSRCTEMVNVGCWIHLSWMHIDGCICTLFWFFRVVSNLASDFKVDSWILLGSVGATHHPETGVQCSMYVENGRELNWRMFSFFVECFWMFRVQNSGET